MIKKYSYKNDRKISLSEHFKVYEFVSHDITTNAQADEILIDEKLVELLEKIRKQINKSLSISSGYRTTAWNKKIGGASKSYHCKGMAADVYSLSIPSFCIAYYAKKFGAGGVEVRFDLSANDYCHIDTRVAKKWDAINKNGNYITVSDIFSTVRKGDKSVNVYLLQNILKWYGFKISVDGIFGDETETIIKAVQKLVGLDSDGIVGKKTWGVLCEVDYIV